MKANILINKDRQACIADFGLSTITGVATHAGASRASLISSDTLMSFTGGGTRRWMSPELLDPERFEIPESEDNRPTRQSDCYALGMVIYEVSGCASRFAVVEFTGDNSGTMRTPPLPRVPVGYPSRPRDYGGGPTDGTGGGRTAWVQRRIVEDHRAMLAGGPQCTTQRRGYPLVPTRRHAVLVVKGVLTRDETTDGGTLTVQCSKVQHSLTAFPVRICCHSM